MALYTAALVRMLQLMKTNGFRGKSFCMMGKQYLNINRDTICEILKNMNLAPDYDGWEMIIRDPGIHQDSFGFFSLYGFSEVHAVDISDYEGADIICDMRKKIPENLYNRFDYVLDGGITEHVFDPALTISNISQMVKPGGLVIHILPAVGYVDHGFYSFSPTFFRDFYRDNGFEIENLDMDFLTSDGSWDLDNYADHMTIMTPDLRLLPNNPDDWSKWRLNNYIKKIYSLESVGHAHLWCVARKTRCLTVSYPMQEDYRHINPQGDFSNEIKDIELTKLNLEKASIISSLISFLLVNGINKRLILFGAGTLGSAIKSWLDFAGIFSAAFCDNDIAKVGKIKDGLKIISPDQLVGMELDNVIVIVTSDLYHKEMEEQLRDMGFTDRNMYVVFRKK